MLKLVKVVLRETSNVGTSLQSTYRETSIVGTINKIHIGKRPMLVQFYKIKIETYIVGTILQKHYRENIPRL